MSKTLKVSSQTDTQKLAGAIHGVMKENDHTVTLQAIGAGAVNQAIKAIAVARKFAAPEGGDLKVIPCFTDIQLEDREVTSVQLIVVWR